MIKCSSLVLYFLDDDCDDIITWKYFPSMRGIHQPLKSSPLFYYLHNIIRYMRYGQIYVNMILHNRTYGGLFENGQINIYTVL